MRHCPPLTPLTPRFPRAPPPYKVDSVGTIGAARTAYAAIHALRPDLVVSAGTAGGFSARGAAIGDLYLATAFRYGGPTGGPGFCAGRAPLCVLGGPLEALAPPGLH